MRHKSNSQWRKQFVESLQVADHHSRCWLRIIPPFWIGICWLVTLWKRVSKCCLAVLCCSWQTLPVGVQHNKIQFCCSAKWLLRYNRSCRVRVHGSVHTTPALGAGWNTKHFLTLKDFTVSFNSIKPVVVLNISIMQRWLYVPKPANHLLNNQLLQVKTRTADSH